MQSILTGIIEENLIIGDFQLYPFIQVFTVTRVVKQGLSLTSYTQTRQPGAPYLISHFLWTADLLGLKCHSMEDLFKIYFSITPSMNDGSKVIANC